MVARRRKGPVYKNRPKKQVGKSFNRAAAAGGVLFLILLVVGFIYTFVADKNSTQPLKNNPIATTNDIIRTPPKTDPNAPVGVSVEAFSSLAYIGTQASISIKTNPNAQCKIEVLYDNVDAVDPGLTPKTADEFGTATWSWTVASYAPPGLWPVNITCANHSKSGVVQAKLAVSKP